MLSTLEKGYIKQTLDEHGVNKVDRSSYFNFAREIKGRKIQTNDDIEKMIEKRKQEGLDEELLKKIAKIVRPEY